MPPLIQDRAHQKIFSNEEGYTLLLKTPSKKGIFGNQGNSPLRQLISKILRISNTP